MIFGLVSSVLSVITRPYIYIQKTILVTIQSQLLTYFDDKCWFILFGVMVALVFLLAYVLSSRVTIRDADDDPAYQRARLYSAQRHHRKMT